uniref:Uncharacterized protein n=1 Tax=Rhizophora mucronata TaxID=61149 RepID=A0A2P2IY95_RHIMU
MIYANYCKLLSINTQLIHLQFYKFLPFTIAKEPIIINQFGPAFFPS